MKEQFKIKYWDWMSDPYGENWTAIECAKIVEAETYQDAQAKFHEDSKSRNPMKKIYKIIYRLEKERTDHGVIVIADDLEDAIKKFRKNYNYPEASFVQDPKLIDYGAREIIQ